MGSELKHGAKRKGASSTSNRREDGHSATRRKTKQGGQADRRTAAGRRARPSRSRGPKRAAREPAPPAPRVSLRTTNVSQQQVVSASMSAEQWITTPGCGARTRQQPQAAPTGTVDETTGGVRRKEGLTAAERRRRQQAAHEEQTAAAGQQGARNV